MGNIHGPFIFPISVSLDRRLLVEDDIEVMEASRSGRGKPSCGSSTSLTDESAIRITPAFLSKMTNMPSCELYLIVLLAIEVDSGVSKVSDDASG